MRAEARRSHTELVEHVQRSPDTTVKAALFEDIAAVIGLVLAAAGLVLRQLTGSGVWDAAASMAIGVLLIVVAVKLGLDSRDLLIGRAADPQEQQVIREVIENAPGVDALVELLTMHLGPDQLLVAARVDFSGDLTGDEAEDLASKIDGQLAERLSVTPHVFVDPTRKGGREDAQTAPEASRPR
jgi:cation diffusion facilitator family transporter